MIFDKKNVRLSLFVFLLLASTSLVAVSNGYAQGSDSPKRTLNEREIVARAKFLETTFNFGTVIEGSVASHSFEFKNIGNTNYIIQRLVAGCGCTAASSSDQSIAPGQSGFIKIDFDTSGFAGEKTKVVRVYSNDIDKPELNLTLTGTVENDIVISPSAVLFDEMVHAVPVAPKEFTVKIRGGSGIKITSAASYSKYLKIEPVASPQSLSKNVTTQALAYRVSVLPEIPVGELRDRIILNFIKGKEVSSRTIPVLGRVSGPIALDPPQVSFGIVEGLAKLERSVVLKNKGATPIELVSITSDTASVVPSYKTIEAGKRYSINIALDPAQVKNDIRALIEIKTTSVEEPSLYLSVFGVTPPKLDF